MVLISRSALVPVSALTMFHVVHDVRAYPRHFKWCAKAEVLDEREHERKARLGLRFAGLQTEFTTQNTVDVGKRIDLRLVDGPFKRLSGVWSFVALSEQGCKVSLELEFEMVSGLVGSALALGFQALADRMVDDFVRVAKEAAVHE